MSIIIKLIEGVEAVQDKDLNMVKEEINLIPSQDPHLDVEAKKNLGITH